MACFEGMFTKHRVTTTIVTFPVIYIFIYKINGRNYTVLITILIIVYIWIQIHVMNQVHRTFCNLIYIIHTNSVPLLQICENRPVIKILITSDVLCQVLLYK